MRNKSKSWLNTFQAACRARFDLQMEAIALCHQVMVLQRLGKRPEFSPFDRILWILISRLWSNWKTGLKIIQPETVKRWNRLGWRVLVSGKYRKNRGGRPPIKKEIRDIIRRMAFENFLWGAPRIHGELLKLGYQVGEATISRYLARFFPGRRRLTWNGFFRNQWVGFGSLSIGAKSMAKIGSLSGLLTEIPRKPLDQPVGSETKTAAGTAAYANRRADIRNGLLISNLSAIRIRGSPLMIAHRETTSTIHLPPTSQCVGWVCVAKISLVTQFS